MDSSKRKCLYIKPPLSSCALTDLFIGSTSSFGIECLAKMEKINKAHCQHQPDNVPNGLK